MKLRPGIDQLDIFIAVAPTMISTNTVNCRNHLVGKSPLGAAAKNIRKFFVNADPEIAGKIFTVRPDLLIQDLNTELGKWLGQELIL
ncbi:MAG: hypothetical protein KJ808_08440 [Acidobacteria bacterium]|nr:hypothetical protein [Acidobacteriota bacterium]MBU4306989.1 hypothetical protein [Acidobacteriota bacterium]